MVYLSIINIESIHNQTIVKCPSPPLMACSQYDTMLCVVFDVTEHNAETCLTNFCTACATSQNVPMFTYNIFNLVGM